MPNTLQQHKNANWTCGSLTLTPQKTCPIASGMSGYWLDGSETSYVLKFRDAAGNDSIGGAKLGYDAVRLMDTTVITIGGGGDYVYSATTKTLTAKVNGALGNIDGVAPAVGNRVLRVQSDAQDGVYTVTSLGSAGSKAVFTRAADMSSTAEFIAGATVSIIAGTANANTMYELTLPSPFTMDTHTPVFTQAAAGVTFAGVKTALAAANSTVGFNTQAINGITTVTAGTSVVTPLVDTAGAAALNIGTTNATSIVLKKSTSLAANADVSCLAGTTAVDLSLGTGTFKPTAGVFTFQGKQAATATANVIADPGTGNPIPVTTSGVCMITTAAAETNTLAAPTFVGQELTLICDTYAVGDRVVTSAAPINQAGNSVMTFGAAADFIVLRAVKIGGALRWRVVANDGVALA